MVMKMPTKSTATSWMAPQVKWLDLRTDTSVVLKERKAARRIIMISSTRGDGEGDLAEDGDADHLARPFWNMGRVGSTPLSTTAATIITRKIRL